MSKKYIGKDRERLHVPEIFGIMKLALSYHSQWISFFYSGGRCVVGSWPQGSFIIYTSYYIIPMPVAGTIPER